MEIENFNEENILTGLMSAVCKTRTCSFDEVLRVLLTDDTLEDNKFIADFGKFDLLESFWKYVEQQFGYSSPAPTLEKFCDFYVCDICRSIYQHGTSEGMERICFL